MNARLLKIVGAVALALVLALASGWVWGASGKVELQTQLEETTLRLHLADARARLLAARVDLYSLNFGAATENLEASKIPLEGALNRFERDGDASRAAHVRSVLSAAEEARSLAAQVNPGAQAAAERALAALGQAARRQGS